ncbi:hypothetical protein MC378_06450 [Polaribacter sp. MSW13]|uniref:WG containing repeat-containing protein n=1 Tax=Polaribacter marinus TaxID=2916838 RepID=A0A9X1VPM2_9FLAO|nr:hypothetical protein [Polaribacter marinus]MCI2228802.1 hypothetical protein [Polaribacter marinus]
MKKRVLTFLCFLMFSIVNAQSNNEIAGVYIKRSQHSLNNLELERSFEYYKKAMKYTDSISSSNVAKLGAEIHYKLDFFEEAQNYAKQYFVLVEDRETDEYTQMLELFVNINEELEAKIAEEKRKAAIRIKEIKEYQKIDSLRTVWNNKSEELSLKVDSIYKFNKNNLALYTKNNSFGVIDERGKIIIAASNYKDAISYEGFILLKDKKENPTKIYCLNTNNKTGYSFPKVSRFNSKATHYGKIMLPRKNGILVAYPNNAYEPLVYDLNLKKRIRIFNQKELLKTLKKNDIIDRYNKEGEVKINKEWYKFGGDLGGGIHPLYFNKSYKVHSFLFSANGKLLPTSLGYEYIGSFDNNKLELIKNGETIWIDNKGAKVNDLKDEYEDYEGDSKIVKIAAGRYQIKRNNVIILEDKELETIEAFLRRHNE